QWIGIDINYLAINLIKRRLKDAFGEEVEFEEKGQPTDFASAKRLAELDKFQFQHWALSLIGARPLKEGEGKGADRGVDGLLYYYETERKRFSGTRQGRTFTAKRTGPPRENHRAGQRRRSKSRRCRDIAWRRGKPESRRRSFDHAGKTEQTNAHRSRRCRTLHVQTLAR